MTASALSPEDELQALISAFPDVGFLVDEDGRYVQVLAGPESEALLFESATELLGKRIDDLYDDPTARRFTDALRSTIETGETTSLRYDLPLDDETRTFEANLAPARTDDPETDYVVWVARDVTERERYRRELERQEGYMRAMLDSLDDFFYVIDSEGNFVDWNSTVRTVTGYTDAELESMDPTMLFTQGGGERAANLITEVLETGRATGEATMLTKEGKQIPFEFVGSLFDAPDGEQLIVGIGRNVTRRQEREQQLRVFERMLRHNVRNEMNVAKGGLESLAGDLPEDRREEIVPVIGALEDLHALTEQTHEVLEELLRTRARTPVDLDRVVRDVIEPYREEYPAVDFRVDDVEDLSVIAIPSIDRALEELVSNAVEHATDECPTVTVTTDHRSNRVILRVIDDGPGIPPADANVLTDDQEITPLFHGSGLGLWLVRWIVTRSKGSVQYREREAGGSVVSLELQRHRESANSNAEGTASDRANG
jgi:PAS domain S-box-containing protein